MAAKKKTTKQSVATQNVARKLMAAAKKARAAKGNAKKKKIVASATGAKGKRTFHKAAGSKATSDPRRWWVLYYYAPVSQLPRVATDYVVVRVKDSNDHPDAPMSFLEGKGNRVRFSRFNTFTSGKIDVEYLESETGIAILTEPRRLVAAKPHEALRADDAMQMKDAGLDPNTATPEDYYAATGEWPSTTGEVKIDVVSVVVTASTLKNEAAKLLGEDYGFIALEPEQGRATTTRVNDVAADLREQVASEWRSAARKSNLSNNHKIKIADLMIGEWGSNIPN